MFNKPEVPNSTNKRRGLNLSRYIKKEIYLKDSGRGDENKEENSRVLHIKSSELPQGIQGIQKKK